MKQSHIHTNISLLGKEESGLAKGTGKLEGQKGGLLESCEEKVHFLPGAY